MLCFMTVSNMLQSSHVFEKFLAGCLSILLWRHLMLLVLLQARYLAPGKAKALVDQYTGR
jgi:hypothetical protein